MKVITELILLTVFITVTWILFFFKKKVNQTALLLHMLLCFFCCRGLSKLLMLGATWREKAVLGYEPFDLTDYLNEQVLSTLCCALESAVR